MIYCKEQQAWARDSLWLLTGHLWLGMSLNPRSYLPLWEMGLELTYLIACHGDQDHRPEKLRFCKANINAHYYAC